MFNGDFEEVQMQKKFIKYTECEVGEVLVQGYYVKTVQSLRYRGSSTHMFRDFDGTSVGLRNAGQLDYFLSSELDFRTDIPVKIVYQGKVMIEDKNGDEVETNQFTFFLGKSKGKGRVEVADEDEEEIEEYITDGEEEAPASVEQILEEEETMETQLAAKVKAKVAAAQKASPAPKQAVKSAPKTQAKAAPAPSQKAVAAANFTQTASKTKANRRPINNDLTIE